MNRHPAAQGPGAHPSVLDEARRTLPGTTWHRLCRWADTAGPLPAVLLTAFAETVAAGAEAASAGAASAGTASAGTASAGTASAEAASAEAASAGAASAGAAGVAVTLRHIDPHLPHSTGLPAGSTVTTIAAVTGCEAAFADRVAATVARLRAANSFRVPADQPVTGGGAVLTIRAPHATGPLPERSEGVECAVTPRSGELCMYWRAAGLPPGAVDGLADAYRGLLAGLGGALPATVHSRYASRSM